MVQMPTEPLSILTSQNGCVFNRSCHNHLLFVLDCKVTNYFWFCQTFCRFFLPPLWRLLCQYVKERFSECRAKARFQLCRALRSSRRSLKERVEAEASVFCYSLLFYKVLRDAGVAVATVSLGRCTIRLSLIRITVNGTSARNTANVT